MNTNAVPRSDPLKQSRWQPASTNHLINSQAKPKPAPEDGLSKKTTQAFSESINNQPSSTNSTPERKPQGQNAPFWKFKRTRSTPRTSPPSPSHAPTKTNTPVTTTLHEALRSSTTTWEQVQLLKINSVAINSLDEQGNTPLHLAVNHDESTERIPIVEWLLSQGAQPAMTNEQGKTPLHLTAVKGYAVMAKLLLKSDPTLIKQPSPGGETALHLAAHYGHLPWLKAVLPSLQKKPRTALLKQADEDGKQALHHACCQGNPELISCLLEAGANVNAKTKYAYTPLHYAARYGFLDVARVLVQAKAKKNVKTKNGQTPLDLAEQYGQQNLVDFLSGKKMPPTLVTPPVHFFSDQLPSSCQEALSNLRASQDVVAQCDALAQLAQEYLDEEGFRAAMLATQAALTLVEQSPDNKTLSERREPLMELSQTIELSFLKSCGIQNPLTFPLAAHQRQLQALREQVLLMAKDDKVQTEEILATITSSAKLLVAELVQEGFSILGESPCPFALISLGSMSRHEMSPYSDLEFAILHPPLKPNEQTVCQNYFRVLTQWLELRVISFRETEDKLLAYGVSVMPKGFRYDEGGNTPLGSPGLFELIQTPEQLAHFQSAKSFEELLILSNTLKTVGLIVGEQALVKEYQRHANGILDSADINTDRYLPQTKKLREQQSLYLMQGDCEEFKPRLDKRKEEDAFFDIKKELYRLPSQTISNLALYFGIASTNTWERIDVLVEKGILSKEAGDRLKQAMRTIGRFRIKVQCLHRCEEEKAFHLGKAPQGATQYYQLTAEDTEALVEVYKVLLPLHKAVEAFVQNQATDCFSQQSFYDDSLISQGEAYQRLLQYEKAREAFQAAVALAPKDTNALSSLGSILNMLGQAKEALRYFEQDLTVSKEVHGESHPEVAVSLNNIGDTWYELGDAQKALEYHEKALAIKRQVYEENHPTVATSLNYMGSAWLKLGENKKALEYLEKALVIRLQVYGENHPAVATSLNNMGHRPGRI